VRSRTIEAEVLKQCLQGDETAWRWVVEHLGGRLHGMAVRLLGDATEAEEAVQETFVEIFRSLPSYRGESAFATWATRICVNVSLRRRERLHRARAVVEAPQEGDVDRVPVRSGARPPTPETETERRERAGLVHAALDRLPEEFRAALVLRELEGMAYAEIASALGTAVGTVKSRVHRGRMMLKDLLTQRLGGDMDAV